MHSKRAELKVRRWRGWTKAFDFEVSRPSRATQKSRKKANVPRRVTLANYHYSITTGRNETFPQDPQALGRYLKMMGNQHSV